MYWLDEIKIEGFWGKYKINTKFNKDVNIYIGKNGTGKTTFINLIQSILQVNIEIMNNINFSTVNLVLINDNLKKQHIFVKKEEFKNDTLITYKINDNVFKITSNYSSYKKNIFSEDIFFVGNNDVNEAKSKSIINEINKLVNLIWLSVNRSNDQLSSRKSRGNSTEWNSVNIRLKHLIEQYTSFKLRLESLVKKKSESFQRDVLTTMLYDEKIDTPEMFFSTTNKVTNLDEAILFKAFELLNILDEEVKDKITKHIKTLKKSSEHIKKSKLDIEDLAPLTLIGRTEKIAQFTIGLEEYKSTVYQPITNFENILKYFMDDKRIYLRSNRFTIVKDQKVLDKNDLSSGEKQLLILLIEVLLKINSKCIFIADEPELSLHISWQENILPSLRELNNTTQIIVATHSPEIASYYPNKIINMKEIING